MIFEYFPEISANKTHFYRPHQSCICATKQPLTKTNLRAGRSQNNTYINGRTPTQTGLTTAQRPGP